MLDQHFAEMARIITSNGGRIYKFIGDAVNISARIEKEAEKLRFQRVLFSEEFVKLSQEKEMFRLHGEFQLKGKSVPIALYAII